MKAAKGFYFAGLILSLLVGIWHFFVPAMFQWSSYIPAEYENLIVGINWTNYFFSLLLTGLSAILLYWSRKVFAGSREAFFIFGFMVFVWLNRALIGFVYPWPLEPVPAAAIGQLAAAILIFALLLAAFVLLRREKAR